MVQQLGLCASTAGDTGLIPSWETKILKLQTAKTEKKKKKKKLSNLYSTKNYLIMIKEQYKVLSV